jgi:hypothetical protein
LFRVAELGSTRQLAAQSREVPELDERSAGDYAETLAFFEEIVWKQNRPLADLLNARVTFVTPPGAALWLAVGQVAGRR